MTLRECLLTALNGGKPERIPYYEVGISGRVLRLLGAKTAGPTDHEGIDALDDIPFSVEHELETAKILNRSHLCFRVLPPVPAERGVGGDGIEYYGAGAIRTVQEAERFPLPDPEDPALWKGAEALIAAAREHDLGSVLVSRMGISPVYLALGTEAFAYALYDDPALVEALLERYSHWCGAVLRKASGLGFDVVHTADDLAYKTGPLLSPDMFRRMLLPYMRRVAEGVSTPWVFHSDGDVRSLLPDLVNLGISGLNPIEPEAMDIVELKEEWGPRIALVGNVSVHLLSAGTPDAVRAEVRRLFRAVGVSGGYLLASGNSIAPYCKPENIRAMVDEGRESGEL